MSQISYPKCSALATLGCIPAWQIIVAICFFPIGLLALLGGRKPTECPSCKYTWQA